MNFILIALKFVLVEFIQVRVVLVGDPLYKKEMSTKFIDTNIVLFGYFQSGIFNSFCF